MGAARGVHPPEVMMHSLPVSNFPLFSKKISDSAENVHNFTFSKTFSIFIRQNFSVDLVRRRDTTYP